MLCSRVLYSRPASSAVITPLSTPLRSGPAEENEDYQVHRDRDRVEGSGRQSRPKCHTYDQYPDVRQIGPPSRHGMATPEPVADLRPFFILTCYHPGQQTGHLNAAVVPVPVEHQRMLRWGRSTSRPCRIKLCEAANHPYTPNDRQFSIVRDAPFFALRPCCGTAELAGPP